MWKNGGRIRGDFIICKKGFLQDVKRLERARKTLYGMRRRGRRRIVQVLERFRKIIWWVLLRSRILKNGILEDVWKGNNGDGDGKHGIGGDDWREDRIAAKGGGLAKVEGVGG